MELTANELRIGNLCNYGGQSHVIDYADIELLARKVDMEEVIEYEPIPLTEELLVKLGFDNSFGMQWYKDGVRVSMATPTTMLFWRDEFNEDEVITLKDKYVHTLQNAWVLITGEELTTK
jgi:hypothetical protein